MTREEIITHALALKKSCADSLCDPRCCPFATTRNYCKLRFDIPCEWKIEGTDENDDEQRTANLL